MTGTYRRRFANWRRERPFWGGLIMIGAGLLIGYIPFNLALSVPVVPSTFAYAGLIFAIVVVLCGAFAIVQPQLATFFGVAGILVSIVSIFGALGGFFVGTLLGILGGSLIVAWEPPDLQEATDEADREGPSLLERLSPSRLWSRIPDPRNG